MMRFSLMLGLLGLAAIAAEGAAVGEFPQIDLELEKQQTNRQKEQNGGESEGAVLQIIDVPPRKEDCKPGMIFIEGRCRKVFMVSKNRTD